MNQIVQIMVDAFSLGGIYALTALGLGIVFSVMRLANFAHAELVTCSAYALFMLSGHPFIVMAAGAFLVAIALAVLTERVAFRPLRKADPATMLIASFTVSILIQRLLVFVFGSRVKPIDPLPSMSQTVLISGAQVSLLKVITIVICFVLLLALVAFLRATSLGLQMRAAAEDFTTSQLVGVRANHVIVLAFILSAALAAIVAILFTAQTGFVQPRLGMPLVLTAFIAAVVGGLGSLPGAVVGGLLVGVASTLLQALLPVDLRPFREAFLFFGVIVILIIRPNGLLPARGMTKRV